MDPFAVIIFGSLAGLIVGLLLLGLFHPRTGADTLDWRQTRSAELEIQNDIDDLDQMLEAANRRRRARGEPELTEESVRAGVGADLTESIKRREDHLADLEVVQMLDAKNRRRKAKGLPEITREEYEAQLFGNANPPAPRSDA